MAKNISVVTDISTDSNQLFLSLLATFALLTWPQYISGFGHRVGRVRSLYIHTHSL